MLEQGNDSDATLVCINCCPSSVQEQIWIYSNSYKRVDGKWYAKVVHDIDVDNFYCPECDEDVAVVQYGDFAVDNNDEEVENNRLSQIMSEADEAMKRNIERRDK